MSCHIECSAGGCAVGPHSVGGGTGEDDDIFPPTVQRLPGPREARLYEPVVQSHLYSDGCHELSRRRCLGT